MNSKQKKEFEVELFFSRCQTMQSEIIDFNSLGIELANLDTETPFSELYNSFSGELISESVKMADCYRIIYCFENDLREIVTDVMYENFGEKWWEEKVSRGIRGEIKERQDNEMQSIFFKRSDEPIFYTTLGELQEIILNNVNVFEVHFRNELFIKIILKQINRLRIVIGHNCLLVNLDIQELSQSIERWYTIK